MEVKKGVHYIGSSHKGNGDTPGNACNLEWGPGYNPGNFIVGKENKPLRDLYNNRKTDPKAWETAWNERLDAWQRKKFMTGSIRP